MGDLKGYIANQFDVADPSTIISFGFRTQFGGGRSTGFCLIYENQSYLKMFEPRYRQIRAGLKQKVERSRKQMKEAKNRGKKVWGTGRRAALKKERRAALKNKPFSTCDKTKNFLSRDLISLIPHMS